MQPRIRTRTHVAQALCLLVAGIMSLAATAIAAPAERYIHVNVQDSENSANVHVNVPLSMAERILPAINNPDLHDGMISLHRADLNGVDLRAVLNAVRTAPDNEFINVTNKDADVRVAKSNGNIMVHVIDKKNRGQKVDVTVPLKVADALVATANNGQLDVAAALRTLNDAGDVLLVTVQDSGQRVRVWIDSRSTQ
ncbi:MAG: hypothetical protein KGL75_13505 [Acidobacteriota bacterium]|nr:hypothetical protein [Acidobacteriota bacterium]